MRHLITLSLALIISLQASVSTAKSTLTTSGDILQIAIPAAALGIATYKGDTEGQKEFLKSFLVNTAITHITKIALKNSSWGKRPSGGKYSFPSGHTASAAQGAFFLQTRYGYEYGAPAIALAAFTGYTRVKGKHHHFRDVVGGAAIAFGVNYFLVSKFEKEKVNITTDIAKDRVILGMNLEF